MHYEKILILINYFAGICFLRHPSGVAKYNAMQKNLVTNEEKVLESIRQNLKTSLRELKKYRRMV